MTRDKRAARLSDPEGDERLAARPSPQPVGFFTRVRAVGGTLRAAWREAEERRVRWRHRATELAGELCDSAAGTASVLGTSDLVPAVARWLEREGIRVSLQRDERSQGRWDSTLLDEEGAIVVASLFGGTHWLRELLRIGVDPSRTRWLESTRPSLAERLDKGGSQAAELSVVLGPAIAPHEAEHLVQTLLDAATEPDTIEVLLAPESARGLSRPDVPPRVRGLPELGGLGAAGRLAAGAWLTEGRRLLLLQDPVTPCAAGWDRQVCQALDEANGRPRLARIGVSSADSQRAAGLALTRRTLEKAPLLLPTTYHQRNLDRHMVDAFRGAASEQHAVVDLDIPLRAAGAPPIELRSDRIIYLLTERERGWAARCVSDQDPEVFEEHAVQPRAPRLHRLRSGRAPRLALVWIGGATSAGVGRLLEAAERELPPDAWEVFAAARSDAHRGWLGVETSRLSVADRLLFVRAEALPSVGTLARLATLAPEDEAVGGPRVELRSGRILEAGLALEATADALRVEPLYRGRPSGDSDVARRRTPALLALDGLCISRKALLEHSHLLEQENPSVDPGAVLTLALAVAHRRTAYVPELRFEVPVADGRGVEPGAPAPDWASPSDVPGEMLLSFVLAAKASASKPYLALTQRESERPLAELFLSAEGAAMTAAGAPLRDVELGEAKLRARPSPPSLPRRA